MADSFAPPGSELSKIGVAAFPTAGQGLALDTSGMIPKNLGVVYMLNKNFDTVTIASSAAEASFSYSNVVANSMGATGALRLTVVGDFLHNNGIADTFTLRVKFGSSTLYANGNSLGGVIGALRHPWVLTVHIVNKGTPDTQMMFGTLLGERADQVAATTGIGQALDSAQILNPTIGVSTTGTVDTSLDQSLVVTGQWSASSVNNSWRKQYSMLELF